MMFHVLPHPFFTQPFSSFFFLSLPPTSLPSFLLSTSFCSAKRNYHTWIWTGRREESIVLDSASQFQDQVLFYVCSQHGDVKTLWLSNAEIGGRWEVGVTVTTILATSCATSTECFLLVFFLFFFSFSSSTINYMYVSPTAVTARGPAVAGGADADGRGSGGTFQMCSCGITAMAAHKWPIFNAGIAVMGQ